MNKIKLCCIFGGVSEEHEVSLVSARSVLENINTDRYEITKVGITKDGRWLLFEGENSALIADEWEKHAKKSAYISPVRGENALIVGDEKIKIDVVLPIMHGKNCEDGRLQGLLELADIPFVGSGTLASALAMDKASTKLVLKNHGIPQAGATLVTKRDFSALWGKIAVAVQAIGYPVFVKPSASGSSCGVSRVEGQSELRSAIERAFAYDDKVLVEQFVKGAEVEVAVLEVKDGEKTELITSVCGEIVPGSEFYDYDNKYKNDTAKYYVPARIDDAVAEKVRKYAARIYRAIGCKSLARVDFFVNGDKITFNEINTLPGFTSISMYPKLMEASGIPYSELIDRLIKSAFFDRD